jgi:acyl carrier protein
VITGYDHPSATEVRVVDALESQVIDIIARKRKLDPAGLTLDSTFEQLGIDSLDAADLLFTFEDTFAIVVPDQTAQSMRSVRDVVNGLQQVLADRTGAS